MVIAEMENNYKIVLAQLQAFNIITTKTLKIVQKTLKIVQKQAKKPKS